MRRISLALALIGAVAATGCGKTSTSNTGGNRGVNEGTFNVTIQNGQGGNTSLAITGGYVTSTPAGLDCGVAPHGTCSFDFAAGTSVILTAVPVSPAAFWGYAGDCSGVGLTCTVTSEATDQYVLARFGAGVPSGGHPNWTPAAVGTLVHSTEATNLLSAIPQTSVWQCSACHGDGLTGAGLAPSCANCHAPDAPVAPQVYATGEACLDCHAGQGAIHQATYNKYSDLSKLVVTIDNVTSVANTPADGTYKLVVTFTTKLNGAAFDPNTAKQKRYTATKYDPATKTFDTATAVSFGKAAATSTAGQYTVTAAAAKFDILTSNAFLYLYFGDKLLLPAVGHYNLMDNVASIGKVYGTLDYVSAANVSACENCHGTPYMKHGYRAAKVAGLPDMVACKACHHDQLGGTDMGFQVLRNEPGQYAILTANGTQDPPDFTKAPYPSDPKGVPYKDKYAYTANVMNDTHMSHAMEFAYPQSMANCVTCHEGKLGGAPATTGILADAKFDGIVCKSCHGTTVGAPRDERAPLLDGIAGAFPGTNPTGFPGYHSFNWTTGKLEQFTAGVKTGEVSCTYCHADNVSDAFPEGTLLAPADPKATDGVGPCYQFAPLPAPCTPVPLMKDLHNGGYNKLIYAAGGTRRSTSVTTSIGAVAFDSATNKLTVPFTMSGVGTSDIANPLVVISLYGFDTKDFLVSGHSNAADGKRNLEASVSAPTTRLTFLPAALAAGTTSWTATADLSLWAAKIGVSVKKVQISVLPALGLDPTVAPQNDSTKAGYNAFVAVGGATATFDLIGNAAVVGYYGSAIVDPAKCNKCHDALGTTFHSPQYGEAGVISCRLCHVPSSGGGHLPIQSRSIDSYVHSIHSMQEFDPANIKWSDPVAVMEFNDHVNANYPNFTTLSCESCHNPGTYEASPNNLALPAVLSASAAIPGWTISGIPAMVTGPAAKACGGCHRAELINKDEAAELNGFEDHQAAFGYGVVPDATNDTTTKVWNQIVKDIFGSN